MPSLPTRTIFSGIFLAAAVAGTAPFVARAQSEPKAPAPKGSESKEPESKSPEAKTPASGASEKAAEKISTTEHEITLNGKVLKYRATAGRVPVQDEGKTKANFFFVSYELIPAGTAPSKRPVTFVFNGGPGSSSVWLHLGAAGPQRVAIDPVTDLPLRPFRLEANPDSWLAATDLVFIDPVGTGYSRAAEGEDPRQFYGVREDIRWVAEFIRRYTTSHQRWLSPKFVAGESYGTTRAAGLSGALQQQGIALDGIILISSVLNFATIDPGPDNDLPYILDIPSYAAVAWYHHKLSPELQADLKGTVEQARQWAVNTYGPALIRDGELSAAERAAINRSLVRFTGLSPQLVEKANMRISSTQFECSLLADRNKIIGRFDARLTGFNAEPLSADPRFDPSFQAYTPAYVATFNDYIRGSLHYENDLTYEVLSNKVWPWNFGPAGNGRLDVSHTLAETMAADPRLRVMFAGGYFDLATPFDAASHTINHLPLDQELRKNISRFYYESGHMPYNNHASRAQLGRDIRGFIGGPDAPEGK